MFSNVAELLDFLQQLTSNLIENPSSTVPITNLVKLHAQAVVANEAKFYVQGVARTKEGEQATPPSPLTGMSPDSSYPSSEEEYKKPKTKKSSAPSISLKSSKMKCRK